jgi:hypothetical protein
MTDRIYKDGNSGTYLVRGKEHSWGSFESWGAAAAFIREVEEEDRKYRARMVEESARIRERLAEEDADRIAALRARLEEDKKLYTRD